MMSTEGSKSFRIDDLLSRRFPSPPTPSPPPSPPFPKSPVLSTPTRVIRPTPSAATSLSPPPPIPTDEILCTTTSRRPSITPPPPQGHHLMSGEWLAAAAAYQTDLLLSSSSSYSRKGLFPGSFGPGLLPHPQFWAHPAYAALLLNQIHPQVSTHSSQYGLIPDLSGHSHLRVHSNGLFNPGLGHHHHNSKRKGGQIRFSHQQTNQLEKAFNDHKYLNANDRKKLAHSLSLSDRQVKTWFQNRRAKWRKSKHEGPGEMTNSTSPGSSGGVRYICDSPLSIDEERY